MTETEIIEALENLHDRIIRDARFLQEVDIKELSALFHVREIIEQQHADYMRLREIHNRTVYNLRAMFAKILEQENF